MVRRLIKSKRILQGSDRVIILATQKEFFLILPLTWEFGWFSSTILSGADWYMRTSELERRSSKSGRLDLDDWMSRIAPFFFEWYGVNLDTWTRKIMTLDSVISNDCLYKICLFVKLQEHNYASHVVRMPLSRSIKLLLFNDDWYKKRGRPSKSLLDQVVGFKI